MVRSLPWESGDLGASSDLDMSETPQAKILFLVLFSSL